MLFGQHGFIVATEIRQVRATPGLARPVVVNGRQWGVITQRSRSADVDTDSRGSVCFFGCWWATAAAPSIVGGAAP